MKIFCSGRNKEIEARNSNYGVCFDRRERDNIQVFILLGIIMVIVLAIFIGIKYAWAIYAYNDWRCMFSECRIIK